MTCENIIGTDHSKATIIIRSIVGAVFLSEGVQKFSVLILLGLLMRLASIPLIIIMLVATTKSEVYLEKGFWKLLHGSRTDWAMLLGGVFFTN